MAYAGGIAIPDDAWQGQEIVQGEWESAGRTDPKWDTVSGNSVLDVLAYGIKRYIDADTGGPVSPDNARPVVYGTRTAYRIDPDARGTVAGVPIIWLVLGVGAVMLLK